MILKKEWMCKQNNIMGNNLHSECYFGEKRDFERLLYVKKTYQTITKITHLG